ncbi:PLC-like phosphodiesterase [Corynascus similis CBS 632.67]
MAAFQGAVAAGADGLETDLHLSRDGVVVLSHDPTLKRCFGVDARIADCDWSYLSTLQTVQEPRQGMPRLVDLLEWLVRREVELESESDRAAAAAVWLLLDIKTNDDPERLLPAVARTIASVPLPGGDVKGWKKRIVVGAWNENYIRHARLHLPGHPLAYIGFSLLYARRFLSDDFADVRYFNLAQLTLVGPLGARFRHAIRERGRCLLVWTVNEPRWMAWSARKGVDGVITDEVARLKGVLDQFGDRLKKAAEVEGEREEGKWEGQAGGIVATLPHPSVRLYVGAMFWQVAAGLLTVLLWYPLNTRGGKGKGGAPLPVKA